MSNRLVGQNRGDLKNSQKKFVPRKNFEGNQNLSSSFGASNAAPAGGEPAVASTNRVRVDENWEWASKNAQNSNFVMYLPQDEALAVGLGPEDGGLDPVESQRVVDLLNKELSRLLKLNPKDFWKEVATDESLRVFLESFLRYRSRWYDFPHRGGRGKVAGVIVGELELSRRVIMVFYRLSSNQDPGAKASETLNSKDHEVLLQDLKLLDLPKLLDICAIYGHENEDLVRKIVVNAIKAQLHIHDEFPVVLSHFLTIAQTMNQRCNSKVEVLVSGGHQDQGSIQLHHDFLEVMDFVNDSVVSCDLFINAYNQAAIYFSTPVETSYGNDELLTTLAKLHDSLLPSLQRGFNLIRGTVEEKDGKGSVINYFSSLKLLSTRLVGLGWRLLYLCYLSDQAFESSDSLGISAKMFPANIDDPSVRTDILIQMIRTLSGYSIPAPNRVDSTTTFIRVIEANHKIMGRIRLLVESGWMAMDQEQYQFLSSIMGTTEKADMKTNHSSSTQIASNQPQIDEDAAIAESRISQIKELFPNHGRGFLLACLEVYNQNAEEVIQRILEGTLHEELQSLDISLEQVPLPKLASSTTSKQDKGKGILEDPIDNRSQYVSAPSSTSSGRFIRKNAGEPSGFEGMNDKELAKTAALISQLEYEDEYDDSFDELGLSVGDTKLDEEESSCSTSTTTNWNSRRKPQFYVKDGKNYSYKVEGSVAVSDFNEARLVNQVQKELIHGLGRGGNIPLGAVKRLTDEQPNNVQDNNEGTGHGHGHGHSRGRKGGHNSNRKTEEQQNEEGGESGGRGNHGGGGGGRRGRGRGRNNNYRKDRAMSKHVSGLPGHYT